jgi:hypothetical protein
MKKLKLKALELGASEVLTREQLRNVLGGTEVTTTKLLTPCSLTLHCAHTDIQCTSKVGNCIDGYESIQCDNTPYTCPPPPPIA